MTFSCDTSTQIHKDHFKRRDIWAWKILRWLLVNVVLYCFCSGLRITIAIRWLCTPTAWKSGRAGWGENSALTLIELTPQWPYGAQRALKEKNLQPTDSWGAQSKKFTALDSCPSFPSSVSLLSATPAFPTQLEISILPPTPQIQLISFFSGSPFLFAFLISTESTILTPVVESQFTEWPVHQISWLWYWNWAVLFWTSLVHYWAPHLRIVPAPVYPILYFRTRALFL